MVLADGPSYGIVFFGTPHQGAQKGLTQIANTSAKIASGLGLRDSSAIVKALQSGSMFSDILRESWRHQLEKYQLVSFWEGKGNVG